MFTYTTKGAYQAIHWINGCTRPTKSVILNICRTLNISQLPSGKKQPKWGKSTSNSNCALFVSGFNGLADDEKLVTELGDTLQKHNCACFVVRSASDNPELFKEVRTFGGLVFVPDYCVVTVNMLGRQPLNVLCVGGNITIDRSWRIKNSKGDKKSMTRMNRYYKDEAPIYDEKAISEIVENKELPINMVVSVTPISFVGEDPFSDDSKWFETDKTLKNDVIKSRENMDNLLKALRFSGKSPAIWFYSVDGGRCAEQSVMGVRFANEDSVNNYGNVADLLFPYKIKAFSDYPRRVSYIQSIIDEENSMSTSAIRGAARHRVMAPPHDVGFNHINPFEGEAGLNADVVESDEDVAPVPYYDYEFTVSDSEPDALNEAAAPYLGGLGHYRVASEGNPLVGTVATTTDNLQSDEPLTAQINERIMGTINFDNYATHFALDHPITTATSATISS